MERIVRDCLGNFFILKCKQNTKASVCCKQSVFPLTDLNLLYQSRHAGASQFTVRTAVDFQSKANLASIFSVPSHGIDTQMFGSERIMKDVPLYLVVIPVARQRLRGERIRYLMQRELNIHHLNHQQPQLSDKLKCQPMSFQAVIKIQDRQGLPCCLLS